MMSYKTAIDIAKERNHPEIVELLLKEGGSPSVTEKQPQSPPQQQKNHQETSSMKLQEKNSKNEINTPKPINQYEVQNQQLIEKNRQQEAQILQLQEKQRQCEIHIQQLTEKNRQYEVYAQQMIEKNGQQEAQILQLQEKQRQYEMYIQQLTEKNRQYEVYAQQMIEKNGQQENEILSLKQKCNQYEIHGSQQEIEIKQLRDENKKQETNNNQSDKIARLESYISSLKEKTKSIEFINIDDYEEQCEIGQGATSSVKLVIKKETEKYAKKELKEFDMKTFQRFLMEGEILFKLCHPCIIKVHGINYGDESHRPCIILSLEPYSLEQMISTKQLNNMQKNRITIEIVLGMRYIHSQNFMHRDLKPSNILLSKNMHVRISDFGLAKEEDISVSQSKGIGTLRFMAPELFEENENGVNYTNKVDVYSFGIMLIYIVTDSYPMFNLKNTMMGILPKLPETIVSWVRDLIFRCLSGSIEKRPSFSEIFDIMKSNNYDMFNENSNTGLPSVKRQMKNEIDRRVLKIEAFEYQHRSDLNK